MSAAIPSSSASTVLYGQLGDLRTSRQTMTVPGERSKASDDQNATREGRRGTTLPHAHLFSSCSERALCCGCPVERAQWACEPRRREAVVPLSVSPSSFAVIGRTMSTFTHSISHGTCRGLGAGLEAATTGCALSPASQAPILYRPSLRVAGLRLPAYRVPLLL